MTDRTEAFKAQFRSTYGRTARATPDYSRCAEAVLVDGGFHRIRQCARKNGHGPEGAWCKQHDPEAVRARRKATFDKWKAEAQAKSRKHTFQRRCQEAVRAIAAGHNDPRGLCLEIIEEMEADQ